MKRTSFFRFFPKTEMTKVCGPRVLFSIFKAFLRKMGKKWRLFWPKVNFWTKMSKSWWKLINFWWILIDFNRFRSKVNFWTKMIKFWSKNITFCSEPPNSRKSKGVPLVLREFIRAPYKMDFLRNAWNNEKDLLFSFFSKNGNDKSLRTEGPFFNI